MFVYRAEEMFQEHVKHRESDPIENYAFAHSLIHFNLWRII